MKIQDFKLTKAQFWVFAVDALEVMSRTSRQILLYFIITKILLPEKMSYPTLAMAVGVSIGFILLSNYAHRMVWQIDSPFLGEEKTDI